MAINSKVVLKFSGAAVMSGLKSIQKGFSTLAKTGLGAIKSLFAPLAKLAAMLGPIAIAAGFTKLSTSAISAAADMEELEAQFSGLLASGEKGKKLMADIVNLNEASPLNLEDMAQGAKTMLAVGSSAEETIDVLDRLGEMAMGSADKFGSLITAFSQVKNMGQFKAQERNQFINAGIDPLSEMAKASGVSMAKLKKAMEEGKISFSDVEKSIKRATSQGGTFYGMNEKMSATTSGKWRSMADQWTRLLVAFGTPINDHLRPMMDMVIAKMKTLGPVISDMGRHVGEYVTAIMNAFNNDELGTLLYQTLSIPVKMVASELLAAFAYGADKFVEKIRAAMGLGPSLKEQQGYRYNMYRAAAQNTIGVPSAREALKNTIDRNQNENVPMNNQAPYGMAADLMAKAVEELKRVGTKIDVTNQKLSFQP